MALYLALLGRRDIVNGAEARVAQTARLMAVAWPWQPGARTRVPHAVLTDIGAGVQRLYPAPDNSRVEVNCWLTPVLQGEIRLQKPPLPYWCAAILLKLFGSEPTTSGQTLETCVRLTPAILGALATLLLFDLGRLTIGRVGGWAAGLVWLASYLPSYEYRLAIPDPYLAFFALACVWAWVKASRARADKAGGLVFLFYLSLGLGALAKGPLVFLHAAIALSAYRLCWRTRAPGRARDHLLGAIVMLAVAAPWYVYVWLRVPGVGAVWRYESLGELASNRENVRAWYFYGPEALLVSLPWTPVWAAGWLLPFVRRAGAGRAFDFSRARDRRRLFPLIWCAATLLFFSLVNQKKEPYLLPAFPAMALLIAQALVTLLAHGRLTWARGPGAQHRAGRRDWPGLVLGAQGLFVAGAALALPTLLRSANPHARPASIVAECAIGLAAGVGPLWLLSRRPCRVRVWLAAQGIGGAVLMALFLACYVTPRDNARSPRPVCAVAAKLLREPDTSILGDVLPEEAAVYLPLGAGLGPGQGTSATVVMVFDDQQAVGQRRRARRLAGLVAGPVPAGEGEVDDSYLRQWDDWVGGGRVVEAHRVPVAAAPGDARWKLFVLKVDRRRYVRVERAPAFVAGESISVAHYSAWLAAPDFQVNRLYSSIGFPKLMSSPTSVDVATR